MHLLGLKIPSQEEGFRLLREWREAVNLDSFNPLGMEKSTLDLRESQPTGPPSTPEEVDSFLKERTRESKREKQNRIAIREAVVGDRPPVVGFTEENPAAANTASAPSVPMDPRRLLWYQMLMREQEKRARLRGESR